MVLQRLGKHLVRLRQNLKSGLQAASDHPADDKPTLIVALCAENADRRELRPAGRSAIDRRRQADRIEFAHEMLEGWEAFSFDSAHC